MGQLKRLVEDTNSSIVINEFFDYLCSVESQEEFDAIESYIMEYVYTGRKVSDVMPKKSGEYKPVFGQKGKISRGNLKHNLGQVSNTVAGGINKFKSHVKDVFRTPMDPIHGFLDAFQNKGDGNSRGQNVKTFFNNAKQKRQDLAKDNRNINDAPRSQTQTISKKTPSGWGSQKKVFNPLDPASGQNPKQKTGFVDSLKKFVSSHNA